MARLSWTDQLQLGVPEIDRQHQKLVEQLAELSEGIQERRPMHALRHVLAELVSYSKYHFNSEENVMRARGWSGLDEHAALHRLFIGRVDLFQQLLGRETPTEVALRSSRFLSAWIVRHIAIADRLAWSSMRQQGLV